MVTARVLVAADKFKGSLTAAQVAERVTTGLLRVVPGLDVETLPVADGGDGTVAAALAAGFERREARVTGPLGDPVVAAYALRSTTAVVEMAEASGLQHLPPGVFAPSPRPPTARANCCGPHSTTAPGPSCSAWAAAPPRTAVRAC